MESIKFKVTDPVGLHARPATILVNAASKQSCELKVAFNGKEVNLKSIMGVMALGVPTQSVVEIIAEGEGAAEAIAALKEVIINQKIGEL